MANQLQSARAGWRFNVIREWQIRNALRFTIYRYRAGQTARDATFMNLNVNVSEIFVLISIINTEEN